MKEKLVKSRVKPQIVEQYIYNAKQQWGICRKLRILRIEKYVREDFSHILTTQCFVGADKLQYIANKERKSNKST